ncbi:hypothetical protein [uncultured Paraglaciecola sp.]|uniref:hypothetical protein n=1 Tax=uncultured Paraglaciecola sp. TaxID=1765024 RepID=UPI0025E03147|nr:hypothetical protein [uncultured Paraglaciecola sp.]
MSNNDKNESFELLAHEKAISELYQNNKQHHTEVPNAQVDVKIMAMAEQQLLDNPSALIKDPLPEQQPTGIQKTPSRDKKSWQWPISLVASVGLLSVLFITQREYFINPTHVASNDVDLLNEPVIQQTPDMNMLEPETEESLVRPSFQAMQVTTSNQQVEEQLNKNYSDVVSKRASISSSAKELKEQMLDSSMFEDDSAKTSAMSLFEMSKLAELLKQELSIKNNSEQKSDTTKINKMQQTLFGHLVAYQSSHADFKITETFLNVLTEKQVQQLTSFGTEAVTDN